MHNESLTTTEVHSVYTGFTDANQEFTVSFPKQLDLLVAKAYVLGFEDLPVR